MFCLLGVGQGFALDCATGTGWGDFLTQEATKGTDGYYEIDTPEKLAWISCKMKHANGSFKDAKVKLTQSIDMQGNLGKVFIPIAAGTGTPPSFNGTFDGQGFTISNLYINTAEIKDSSVSAFTAKSKNGDAAYAQNIGLFGIISTGAKIQNLTLKDVQIYASASAGSTGINSDKPISVGTVVGWASEGGTISNCVASGSIETSGATTRVGGIAGNVKSVTITNCVSSVSVTASGASTNVGGIVGALRNNGTVNISSCVYSGNSLYTVDGSVGAIAGSYESVNKISTEDLFYSEEFCATLEDPADCNGIGVLPDGKTFNTEQSEDLNSEDVVCALNGGTWNEATETCSGTSSDVWSVGQSDISMNGSDGYKVTFSANGGAFASGAKHTKILAKDAAITADEIAVPTRDGKKFAGWATTNDAEEPSADLGTVSAATTIYAVWYDFYTVTFETNPETHTTYTVQVPKHGTISVEGFTVPGTYLATDPENEENTIKYYFTGWGGVSKMLDVGVDPTAEDTLHLAGIDVVENVNLYAVWTKAKTFSVTFDATLHGKTDVRIVKIVNEGDAVSEPNPNDIISDAGYEVAGWCEVENCTEANEYEFSSPLEGNLTLYARWNVVQFNVDYVLDGGTNGNNPSTYTIQDADIVLADPTKTGAIFEGWFYDAEFTNPATKIDAGSTGDKTVYAKWKQITYTIQYLSGNTIYATAKNVTKNYGETIQLNGALEEFAHGGCVQDGWSKVDYGQEGYAVDYELGADYEDNANLKVFPHWNCNTYTITYEIYGAAATNRNPETYTGPAKLTLENAYDPSKKLFFMDNWYKEPTFKTAIRDIQNIDANLTLYAQWYNNIVYNPGSRLKAVNSKLGSTTDKKFWDKTHTIRSSIKDFVLANYTLDGWSTTDGGEKVYELGEKYTTNENLTLYPHWTPEAFPIVYHNIEGATFETPNPETYTVEDELPIDLNSPSKPGYNFLGWSLEENSTEYVDGIAAGSTGEANFYANWEKVYPFLVNDYGAIKVYEDENGKLTAELDGASSGSVDVITDEDNVVVDKVVLNRTFTVNETSSDQKYATIVLPFTIDQNKISGAEFFEFVDVDLDKNQVSFCNAFDGTHTQLVANTPYIVRATAANITFNLAEGETVKLNTSEMNNPVRGTTSRWEFRGTYSYKKWEEGDPELGSVYGYTAKAKYDYAVGQFAKNGAGAFVRPFRANLFKLANQQARRYMLAKSSVALNSASIGEETVPSSLDVVIVDRETEQTTAIGKLNTATGEIKIIDNWFDMKGRKLNDKPTTKGIYYYNGKRVMVK